MQNSGSPSLSTWSVLHCCRETNPSRTTASSLKQHWTHRHGGVPGAEQEQAENWAVTHTSNRLVMQNNLQDTFSQTVALLKILIAAPTVWPQLNLRGAPQHWRESRASSGSQCHGIISLANALHGEKTYHLLASSILTVESLRNVHISRRELTQLFDDTGYFKCNTIFIYFLILSVCLFSMSSYCVRHFLPLSQGFVSDFFCSYPGTFCLL